MTSSKSINFVIRTLIAFIIIAGLTSDLWAAEGRWFGYPVLELGVESDLKFNKEESFFCEDPGDYVASLGVRQPVYRYKGFGAYGTFHHNSCWNGADKPSYDAVGIRFELDTEELFK